MIARERYMRQIRDYIDRPVVKVLTGMRRVGKSALLEMTKGELHLRSIREENIFLLTSNLSDMST